MPVLLRIARSSDPHCLQVNPGTAMNRDYLIMFAK
jgi:hypothetical protein